MIGYLFNILNKILKGQIVVPKADKVDGYDVNSTPTANTLLPLDSNAKFPLSAIYQGSESGLDADKVDGIHESVIVRTDNAKTIIVQHTFNPSSAGAPFILGTNAQGQLVSGLNADKVDNYDASQSPGIGLIPVSGSNGRLAFGWLENFQILTFGTTINWDLSQGGIAKVVLTGNATLANPTNMVAGGTYILIIQQGSTGGRTLSFGTAYKWAEGKTPALTPVANAIDIITFVCDGTYMYGVCQNDFK